VTVWVHSRFTAGSNITGNVVAFSAADTFIPPNEITAIPALLERLDVAT
jgi:hypothetical protein